LEESSAKVKAFCKANELVYDATNHSRLLFAMGFNTVTTEDCIGYIGMLVTQSVEHEIRERTTVH